MVKETEQVKILSNVVKNERFQSPLGEVVKETFVSDCYSVVIMVSIPSRGSGKGDDPLLLSCPSEEKRFQSPLGEVVKETYSSHS